MVIDNSRKQPNSSRIFLSTTSILSIPSIFFNLINLPARTHICTILLTSIPSIFPHTPQETHSPYLNLLLPHTISSFQFSGCVAFLNGLAFIIRLFAFSEIDFKLDESPIVDKHSVRYDSDSLVFSFFGKFFQL